MNNMSKVDAEIKTSKWTRTQACVTLSNIFPNAHHKVLLRTVWHLFNDYIK
jgi:hypothetical protein